MARALNRPLDTFGLAAHPKLARIRRQLESFARNSIRLFPVEVDGDEDIPVGATKLGGRPDLPNGTEWPWYHLDIDRPSAAYRAVMDSPVLPEDGNVSLPFIGQFNLEDLWPYDVDQVLPKTGMLYFFYNDATYETDVGRRLTSETDGITYSSAWMSEMMEKSGMNGGHLRGFDDGYTYFIQSSVYDAPGRVRILYIEGTGTLIRTSFPANLPECDSTQYKYKACKLRFSRERLLPKLEQGILESADTMSPDESELWSELLYDFRANHSVNQMLGYADTCSHGCGVNLGLFPESTYRYEKATQEENVQMGLDNRLILQLDSDVFNRINLRIGRRFYISMRNQDLLKKDFSRVWADIE